jgi:hypothetical protein
MEVKTYYFWQGVAKKSKLSAGGIHFGVVAEGYGTMIDKCADLFGSEELGCEYFEVTAVNENWLPWLQGEIVGEALKEVNKEK